MEASTGSALVFELAGEGIEVGAVVAPDGSVERISHSSGGGEPREFSGEQISNAVSPQGTRATVTLRTGANDGPVVAFTVILPIVESPGEGPFDVTAGALTTTSRSLFGGVRPGPQQSHEGATLTGTASGSAGGGSTGSCRDWHAMRSMRPGSPIRLIVTGTCTFPTPGFSVELRPRSPQGINPADYLLDRIVTAPGGQVPQVLDDVEVRYEEETDFPYETVTILPGGPTIEVVEAH